MVKALAPTVPISGRGVDAFAIGKKKNKKIAIAFNRSIFRTKIPVI